MRAPGGFDEAMAFLKEDIFSSMNCIKIGKIQSFDKAVQSAEIELTMKAEIDGQVLPYPVLVDCPVVTLQGGGAFIEMPIKAGDYCLVFFNDRDIDNWWVNENDTVPRSSRKHSLSDGIALVGLTSKNSPFDMAGGAVVIHAEDYPVKVKGETIELNGDSKKLVTYAELNSALSTFLSGLSATLASGANGGGPVAFSVPLPSSIDISAAETTTIKTGG
jgi:hypothetical protein